MKMFTLWCGETENRWKPLFFDNRGKKATGTGGMAPGSDPETLRNTLDSLDAGALVIDLETCKILYINSYTRDIFGNVEGKICWQVLQENQGSSCPFCNNRQLVNDQGEPAGILVRELKNTRNNRWYECRDSAVYWVDGRVARLEIATDITERKREEEEHARKMKLEALSVLAERIVHDFNKLLSMSMGYLSLARLHVSPDNPVSGFLEKTEEAFMKSGELSARLFALTGEGRPFLCTVALDSILLDSVRLFLRGSELKCAFVLADPLWPVRIDEDQIGQVIFQLLQNARQAMPEGGQVTIRADNVYLSAGEKGDLSAGIYVCWSVEDQGIGISVDDLSRIFDPGFANWPSGKSKKSGWGLAACHSIIKKHQGHIECRSEPAIGTTFTTYLPAEAAP